MSEHFIELCRYCNAVISQCRCIDRNKVQRLGVCSKPECQAKMNADSPSGVFHDGTPFAERTGPWHDDKDICAQCGHAAFHHANFGRGPCQNLSGCEDDCLIFERMTREL